MKKTNLFAFIVIFMLSIICWFFIQKNSIVNQGNIMLDHTSISVNDYEKSLNFYDQTLEILGYKRNMTIDIPGKQIKVAGYGKGEKPSFWISPMGEKEEYVGRARGVHFAFLAPSIEAVDAWYKKCLEVGGKDNGTPGPRPHYHSGYYGAFIIDPSGWRIEAVFHGNPDQFCKISDELPKLVFNELDDKTKDVACIGCSLQKGELESIGGIISSTKCFEARQDYAVPIPGFIIIASKRHVQSIDEFTVEERKDFIEFLCSMRKGMREQLGIDTVYLIQEEDSAHFHMWLFPRYEWMEQFGKKIKSVKPIMKWAQEHLQTEENILEIQEFAEKLKKCF